jgi:DNA-binding NarL/FixJ family response regulator
VKLDEMEYDMNNPCKSAGSDTLQVGTACDRQRKRDDPGVQPHCYHPAGPGPEHIAQAAAADFDLVISDRGMPNMTGDQLAGELISIRPEIPVIICTGFCDENDEKRSMYLGVKGFLKKPVATGDLAEMVRKVLDEFAGYCAAKDKGFDTS